MKPSEYIRRYGDEEIDIYKLTVKNKDWFPEIGEIYWVTLSYGGTISFEYENSSDDKALFDRYKPCATKEEAEFEDAKKVFLRFMEDEFKNHSDEIDWNNLNQSKSYLIFNHSANCMAIWEKTLIQEKGFHTTNKKWLKQFIKDYNTEIEMYYFEIKGANNKDINFMKGGDK